MPRSFEVDVVPAVLVWARKAARLRVDEAAKQTKIAEAKLDEFERGEKKPTLAQLKKLAAAYNRPLAILLLDEPPAGWQPMKATDFRSLAQVSELPRELVLAIEAADERRSVVVELEGSDTPPGTFDVRATLDENAEDVARRIRDALSVTLKEQLSWPDPDAALSRWKRAIEATNVLVYQFRGISTAVARGFSISADRVPVVACNSTDAPTARVFTLMHELAHVALRSDISVCDTTDASASQFEVEAFCNYVAGAVLVPRDALLAQPEVIAANAKTTWRPEQAKRLATRFRVSREVLLRRLLIIGKTSKAHYAEWREVFAEEAREYQRARKQPGQIIPYATTMLSGLGTLYPSVVLDAYHREAISANTALSYLGVKAKQLPVIESSLLKGWRA